MPDPNDSEAPNDQLSDTPGDRDSDGPIDRGPDVPDDRPDGRHPTASPQPRQITIQIDRTEYVVPPTLLKDGTLAGAQIRRLADPDIGADRDVFEIVPGGSDKKIEADAPVEIRNGMRFFSAPATINPGSVRRGTTRQGSGIVEE